MTQDERKQAMRQDIMTAVKANNIPVAGELWLGLVFMSETNLVKMCHELHIQPPPKEAPQ